MICSKCGLEKVAEDFYWNSGKRRPACKSCIQESARVSSAKRRRENSEDIRRAYLKHHYNKTPEWYEEQLRSQGGHCALCPSTSPGGRSQKWFCVDHDHSCCPGKRSCGKCVRGLLCAMCNTRLGWLENHAQKLINYRSFGAVHPQDRSRFDSEPQEVPIKKQESKQPTNK